MFRSDGDENTFTLELAELQMAVWQHFPTRCSCFFSSQTTCSISNPSLFIALRKFRVRVWLLRKPEVTIPESAELRRGNAAEQQQYTRLEFFPLFSCFERWNFI